MRLVDAGAANYYATSHPHRAWVQVGASGVEATSSIYCTIYIEVAISQVSASTNEVNLPINVDVVVSYGCVSKGYLASNIEVVCIECSIAIPTSFKYLVVEVYDYYLVAVCYVASIASATVSTTLPVATTKMSAQVVYARREILDFVIVVVDVVVDVRNVLTVVCNVWHCDFKQLVLKLLVSI